MNSEVHLAIPPNIARHTRSQFTKRFPGLSIGTPDIHMEMYQTAATCGAIQPPALTVSAYPQLVDNILRHGASSFSVPNRPLPLLRSELVALGMTPPSPLITIVSVVPCVLACNNSTAAEVQDWEDLCTDKLKGVFATPPPDTPLPYLFSAFMSHTFGDRSDRMLERLDTTSTPLDINKRVDAGDLAAGLLIPALADPTANRTPEWSGPAAAHLPCHSLQLLPQMRLMRPMKPWPTCCHLKCNHISRYRADWCRSLPMLPDSLNLKQQAGNFCGPAGMRCMA